MKIYMHGLKQGITRFTEKISSGFIEKPYKRFYPNDFRVGVEVDKFDQDIRLKVEMESTALLRCDSCLKAYEKHVQIKQQQLYKIGPVPEGLDHEIIYLTHDTVEIDLSSLLAEGVLLNHPIKMQCRERCKGLCSGCGEDLNIEKCTCEEKDIDPRWEKLRNLTE